MRTPLSASGLRACGSVILAPSRRRYTDDDSGWPTVGRDRWPSPQQLGLADTCAMHAFSLSLTHTCRRTSDGQRGGRGIVFAAVAGIAALVASESARAEPPGLFSGAYIGLNAGAAWGQSSFSTNPNCPPAIVDAPFCNAAPDPSVVERRGRCGERQWQALAERVHGGVQAGYNWQRGSYRVWRRG